MSFLDWKNEEVLKWIKAINMSEYEKTFSIILLIYRDK